MNMIARISILLFVVILLPDIYIYRRHLCRRALPPLWQRVLWWVPCWALLIGTAAMCSVRGFAPTDQRWLGLYLVAVTVLAVPKAVFAMCSLVGRGVAWALRSRRNYGVAVGAVLAVVTAAAAVYGFTLGTRQLVVRHVDISLDGLPPAFEGYRIVQLSDIHAGTLPEGLLGRAVDSVNAARADAVMFTGDLQNMEPSELTSCSADLRRLRGRDGVFAVLGNHDYSMYVSASAAVCADNERRLREAERGFGWRLLANAHSVVRRGSDSIVVAGTENDGRPPFPSRADYGRALDGVVHGTFVVMMQHDPWAWETSVLPRTSAALTLSGHTHGGQMSVMGWRPTMLVDREDCGLYRRGGRALYVSSGLGGFAPFRLNMPPEVVVITLHARHCGHAADAGLERDR